MKRRQASGSNLVSNNRLATFGVLPIMFGRLEYVRVGGLHSSKQRCHRGAHLRCFCKKRVDRKKEHREASDDGEDEDCIQQHLHIRSCSRDQTPICRVSWVMMGGHHQPCYSFCSAPCQASVLIYTYAGDRRPLDQLHFLQHALQCMCIASERKRQGPE